MGWTRHTSRVLLTITTTRQPAADLVGRLPSMRRKRIHLLHGSLTYRDKRLGGYDAAAVIEVIEHLDPPRLAAFERRKN